ncbi:MAG: FadR family transcriptional regulator, partial [Blastocatellia bacterium]|nr:FadR family transcriptional regulator [Blastocatellia bacterium]
MTNNIPNDLSAAMAPIDRVGITELVVERIKELLARGELKAGSRLPPERELADMLNISRPSLRTALKALSVMGIIHAKPGAGTYIADSLPAIFTEPMRFMTLINNTSIEELFEARRIIEAGLAELAAERASADDVQSLNYELDGMRATTADPENFLMHDVRFHQAIAHTANNKVMSLVMDTVAEMLFHIRRQTIARASDMDEALEWHQKIIDAIRKHDPKRAKDAVSNHLRAALEAYVRDNRGERGRAGESGRAGEKEKGRKGEGEKGRQGKSFR